jgi:sarcosine oxidase, subunit gamma
MDEFQAILPAAGSWGTVRIADTQSRVVFHTRDAKAAGLSGPILSAAPYDGGYALQLGPDEWLLLDCQAKTHAGPQSSVDVSNRQIGIALDGPRIAEILSCGVALDLDQRAFPIGMATRTLLGKAEIILWRTGEASWQIEVWRSYAPYALRYLQQAIADLP